MRNEPTVQELRMMEALMAHSRTSCGKPGNAYFNESGFPRCEKCAIQYRLNEGEWPHGAVLTDWRINANIRLEKRECEVNESRTMFSCNVDPRNQ